jgi:hypothetical protein
MSPGVTITSAASPKAGRSSTTCLMLQLKTVRKVERIKTLRFITNLPAGVPIPADLHTAMLQEQP